jgi:hypothetical protein
MFAGATGAAAPSKAAEIAAGVGKRIPPGSDEAAAQMLQVAANMAVVSTGEFMDATIRQHGRSPSVTLNEKQISTQIQQDSKKQ